LGSYLPPSYKNTIPQGVNQQQDESIIILDAFKGYLLDRLTRGE
jgi:hypothetical protein